MFVFNIVLVVFCFLFADTVRKTETLNEVLKIPGTITGQRKGKTEEESKYPWRFSPVHKVSSLWCTHWALHLMYSFVFFSVSVALCSPQTSQLLLITCSGLYLWFLLFSHFSFFFSFVCLLDLWLSVMFSVLWSQLWESSCITCLIQNWPMKLHVVLNAV